MNSDLTIAINHLCTYTEAKILFAATYYKGANPTFVEIQKVTGITQPNNYFKARKQLLNIGYLIIDGNGMYVNADAILKDYKEEFVC